MRFLSLFILFSFWSLPSNAQLTLPAPIALETLLSETNQKITNILIPISEDTQTAVFQRNGYVYVILNKKTISEIPSFDSSILRGARLIDSSDGVVLQFLLAPDYSWFVNRRGRYLILTLSLEKQEDKVISIYPRKEQNALSFNIEPTSSLTFTDPISGEDILVFPILLHEQKMERSYATEAFELPETDQGLVFISHIPDIKSYYKDKKLIITSDQNLLLNNKIVFTPEYRDSIADFSEFIQTSKDDFYKERNRLQDLISTVPKIDKIPFKKELARLYLSQNLGLEAQNIIDSIPLANIDNEFLLLKMTALLAQNRHDLVSQLLKEEQNLTDDFLTTLINFTQNPEKLPDSSFYTLYNKLPPRLFLSFAFQALPHLLEQKEITRLSFLLRKIQSQDLNAYQKQTVAFYTGQIHLYHKNISEARSSFQTALNESPLSPSQIQSHYQLILIDLKQGLISNSTAINNLENLRFTYRKSSFASSLLKTLTQLYKQEKDYVNALRTYRSLFLIHHDAEKTKEMSLLFQEVMLYNKQIPAIDKLALFYEFKELIPFDETANQIMMGLIDNLIDLDLLKQAFNVSLSLAKHRLKGQKQQDFLFKATLIALLNRNISDAQTSIDLLWKETPYHLVSQASLSSLKENKSVNGEKILIKENLYFLHPTLINYLSQQGWLQ